MAAECISDHQSRSCSYLYLILFPFISLIGFFLKWHFQHLCPPVESQTVTFHKNNHLHSVKLISAKGRILILLQDQITFIYFSIPQIGWVSFFGAFTWDNWDVFLSFSHNQMAKTSLRNLFPSLTRVSSPHQKTLILSSLWFNLHNIPPGGRACFSPSTRIPEFNICSLN